MKAKKRKQKVFGSQQIKKHKAWRAFSLYIRTRDKKCVTCGATTNLAAGHYKAGSICGKTLFMSEINVNAQCSFYCNGVKHGNMDQYTLYLQGKYGDDITHKLEAIRVSEKNAGIICRFTADELEVIYQKYTQLLSTLQST